LRALRCSGVLSHRKNHFAFSFVSRSRNRPLNLAAETKEGMLVRMS
jgi:hypothetical protein